LRECIYQLEHYIWDEYKNSYDRDPKDKPKMVNTHFPDLFHYLGLSRFQMYKPTIAEGVGNPYAIKNN
jgi:hypothetical protein